MVSLVTSSTSSESMQPAYFLPYHESNPTIFMQCSEPSSRVDKGVDNWDDIKTHVVVEDIEVIVNKHPRC